LPQWYDCYDYACLLEYLGNGIYGSKKTSPLISAEELGAALTAVVGKKGEETSYQKKAKELGVLCKSANGRGKAAEIITKSAWKGGLI
jgi:hypothetical protein